MGNIITVDFRGDQLCAFERGDGVYVALRPIVEAMGLDWSAQFRRVQRDPILSKNIAMMATITDRPGPKEVVCLKLDLVNGWLFTIDSSRIKDEEVRERVLVYQEECHKVLFNHFYRGARPNLEADAEADDIRKAPVTERLKQVTEARHTFSTSAAREMWFMLGLPLTPSMTAPDPQRDWIRDGAVIDHKVA